MAGKAAAGYIHITLDQKSKEGKNRKLREKIDLSTFVLLTTLLTRRGDYPLSF